MADRLLEIKGLKVHFDTEEGTVQAVDGVDLGIDVGETLGVVGVVGDSVGEQIAEVIRLHENPGRRAALERAVEMLRLVHISNPERRIHDYPHQFSGGMLHSSNRFSRHPKAPARYDPGRRAPADRSRARLPLCRAVLLRARGMSSRNPPLLEVAPRHKVACVLHRTYLFIAHDLSVVEHISDRVAVMYLGRMVESAPARQRYTNPRHPYTAALLSAVPIPEPGLKRTRTRLTGDEPNPLRPPAGCPFHPRCPPAMERCKTEAPLLKTVDENHSAACHLNDPPA